MSIWRYANPRNFMSLTGKMMPWLAALSCLTLVAGLIWAVFLTEDDYRQGAMIKIFYLHVPSATLGTGIWFMMLAASLIWFIRRHPISALSAKAAAPIGLMFTLMGMLTGAIWGKPMWGTYWAWDPRLTSFFILFVFYLAYVALWASIEDRETAADLTSILCLVGSVFAVISRYAVHFWAQGLHQGASMSLGSERQVDDSFFWPAILCFVGFFLTFLWLLLMRTRSEVRKAQIAAREVQNADV